jgi:hypothetical protein
LWYNIVHERESSPHRGWQRGVASLISGRLIGLQGRIARPFWGVMGLWAVLCGAVASSRFRWQGDDLLMLGLVLLLADLAWGSLWDLATGTDWVQFMAEGWPPERPASLVALPYAQPNSPGGRLARGLSQVLGWWRETFWPAAGSSLLGVLAALMLVAVLTLLLPERLRPLNAILAALIGLGLVQRCRGRAPLAGDSFVQVTLSWLAGYLVFAEMNWPSLALALSFALAIWGSLRIAHGLRGGLWLLDGGQVIAAALLVGLKQPLAAVAMGLLLMGQTAFQLVLHQGAEPASVSRRMWPWLMATMVVAALAVP